MTLGLLLGTPEEVGLESMTTEGGVEITPRPDNANTLIRGLSVAACEHLKTLRKANLVEMGLLIFPQLKYREPTQAWSSARVRNPHSHIPPPTRMHRRTVM